MSRNEPIATRRIAKRLAWLKSGKLNEGAITEKQKAAIISLVSHGATVVEVEAMAGMPSAATIYRACKSDPAFGAALDEAQRIKAALVLEEAHHNMREAMDSNDPDTVRNAAAYVNASTLYAERIAPREFGPLLKHAGHDGGQLVVNTVSYQHVLTGGPVIDDDTHARETKLLEAKET